MEFLEPTLNMRKRGCITRVRAINDYQGVRNTNPLFFTP